MRLYTFVIGSMDDFETIEELMDWHENKTMPPQAHGYRVNASTHEFEAPDECDQDTVVMIGRGIAFSSDWCQDDTFSFVVDEGPARSRTEMQDHDPFEAGLTDEQRRYLHLSQCSEV